MHSNLTLRHSLLIVSLLCVLATSALAQQAKVERIGAVAASAVSPEVAAAVEDKGYRVTLDDGWSADLWLVKDLKLTTKDAPNALYPGIGNGEFVGVISLPKGMSDFRGQAVPAGTYTLRYQYIPQDANHMGVSPNPDFLLAVPAASDANPGANYLYKKLVSLSSKTTGAHPAVLAMESAGDPGQAVFEDKLLVLTAAVKSSGAEPVNKIGIVVKGQAAQ